MGLIDIELPPSKNKVNSHRKARSESKIQWMKVYNNNNHNNHKKEDIKIYVQVIINQLQLDFLGNYWSEKIKNAFAQERLPFLSDFPWLITRTLLTNHFHLPNQALPLNSISEKFMVNEVITVL